MPALRPELVALGGMTGKRRDLVMRFGGGPLLPYSPRRPVAAVISSGLVRAAMEEKCDPRSSPGRRGTDLGSGRLVPVSEHKHQTRVAFPHQREDGTSLHRGEVSLRGLSNWDPC